MGLKNLFRFYKNDQDEVKLSFSFKGLRGRILTVVMIPLLFLVIVAGISLFQTQVLSKSLEKTLTETVPAVTTGKQLQQEIKLMQNYFLLALTSKADEDALGDYLDRLEASMDKFVTAIDRYRHYEMTPKAESLRMGLLEGWDKLRDPLTEAKKILAEKKFDQAKLLFIDKIKPELNNLGEVLQNIELNNADTIELAKSEGIGLGKKSKVYALTGALLAILISLSVSSIFATFISKTFARIGINLSRSVEEVTKSAAQIANSSQQLSDATNVQAASLEETSAAIEETSSMVKKNSENSKNAASTSTESREKALKGKAVVDKMIEAMNKINESNSKIMKQIDSTNKQTGEIVTVIHEIENKTKVINEIVFQTKLLSFNASVEAARAGEQGKGFAVVAEEVGNLAQMSGNAAKEITDLLSSSISKVESIIDESKTKIEILIADGRETVLAGTKVAHECGEVLNEIMEKVARVSSMAEEISSASDEQAEGVHEISKAMLQLDKVTQQNAASSNESAGAAGHLAAQAENLRVAVQHLVSTIQGPGSTVNQ